MKKTIKEKIGAAAIVAAFVVMLYVVTSWIRFTIVHPSAGDGAFYVYFVEVVTWKDVPKLEQR
jgi:hypothetical protein